jgi:ABC-type molybdate transport system substrate-binding protein
MSEDKKHPPHDLDLDAQARIALSKARAMPPGPERTKALKKAGILRNAADAQKITYARRGRPPKD